VNNFNFLYFILYLADYNNVKKAFETSMQKLGLEYLDARVIIGLMSREMR
jgi:predicted aldo/keto reductase-like oxidoreductase